MRLIDIFAKQITALLVCIIVSILIIGNPNNIFAAYCGNSWNDLTLDGVAYNVYLDSNSLIYGPLDETQHASILNAIYSVRDSNQELVTDVAKSQNITLLSQNKAILSSSKHWMDYLATFADVSLYTDLTDYDDRNFDVILPSFIRDIYAQILISGRFFNNLKNADNRRGYYKEVSETLIFPALTDEEITKLESQVERDIGELIRDAHDPSKNSDLVDVDLHTVEAGISVLKYLKTYAHFSLEAVGKSSTFLNCFGRALGGITAALSVYNLWDGWQDESTESLIKIAYMQARGEDRLAALDYFVHNPMYDIDPAFVEAIEELKLDIDKLDENTWIDTFTLFFAENPVGNTLSVGGVVAGVAAVATTASAVAIAVAVYAGISIMYHSWSWLNDRDDQVSVAGIAKTVEFVIRKGLQNRFQSSIPSDETLEQWLLLSNMRLFADYLFYDILIQRTGWFDELLGGQDHDEFLEYLTNQSNTRWNAFIQTLPPLYWAYENADWIVSKIETNPLSINQCSVPNISSFMINDGDDYTTNPDVQLNINASENPNHYMVSESSNFSGAVWQPFDSNPSFTLSSGYGLKTVYIQVKNDYGLSSARSDSIVYDSATSSGNLFINESISPPIYYVTRQDNQSGQSFVLIKNGSDITTTVTASFTDGPYSTISAISDNPKVISAGSVSAFYFNIAVGNVPEGSSESGSITFSSNVGNVTQPIIIQFIDQYEAGEVSLNMSSGNSYYDEPYLQQIPLTAYQDAIECGLDYARIYLTIDNIMNGGDDGDSCVKPQIKNWNAQYLSSTISSFCENDLPQTKSFLINSNMIIGEDPLYINIRGQAGEAFHISNAYLKFNTFSGDPDVAVTKSVSNVAPAVNENVTVTLNFVNNGPNESDDGNFDDRPLTSGLEFVSGEIYDTSTPDLEPEETDQIQYVIRATQPGVYSLPGTQFSYSNPCETKSFSTTSNPVTINVHATELDLETNVNPDGAGVVQKTPDKTIYSYQETVSIEATPNIGYQFTGWSGDGCSGIDICILQMNVDKSVTANFAPLPLSLIVPFYNNSGMYDISWNQTGGVVGYEIEESTNGNFTENLTQVYSGNELTTTLSKADSGTYYYRIRAVYQSEYGNWFVSDNPCIVETLQITEPILAPINDFEISEADSYTSTPPILEQGTLPITWTLEEAPQGMNINMETGVISWTNPSVSGSPHSITIRATNSEGFDDESFVITVTTSSNDLDQDGYDQTVDCNDNDATVYPGAPELCDGILNDCNSSMLATEVDNDGDGYVTCSIPDMNNWKGSSSVVGGDDCNDGDSNEHPNQTWYKDSDGDGHSDGTTDTESCSRPQDYFVESELQSIYGDNDDNDSTVYVGAPEICDGKDNNQDGQIDENLPCDNQLIDKIVWVSESSGNHDIWMMNPDGTDKVQLTTDPGIDNSPMISPDGLSIAFSSNRMGENRIYLMDTDGSNQRWITGDNCNYPAWSPDGSKIYFGDYSSGTGLISVMDSDGSNAQSLGISGNRVTVSPDGTKLSYYPPANSNPNSYDVYIANNDGTGEIDLSVVAGLTGYEIPYSKTAWGSSGKILLTAQEPTWLNTTDYDIYWVNADGSASGALLDESNNYNSSAGWSPDEQKIIFASERSGNRDIHVMDSDGTNIVQLTTDVSNDSAPHWGKIVPCNSWTETSSLDVPINSPGAAFVENGYIYSPGGWQIAHGTFHYAPINTDGSLGTWQATTSMPNGHHTQHSATSYNGAIYLVGGHQPNWWTSSVYIAVPEADGSISSWSTATSLPASKGGSGAFGYNGYLYSTGGTNGSSGGQNALTEVLFAQINEDSSIGTWQTTSSLPVGRCFHGATGYNGFAYVVGGEYAGPTKTAVEVLFAPIQSNGEIGSWSETVALPAEEGENLVGCKIYAVDDYLYLLKQKGFNYRAFINPDGSLSEWKAWRDTAYDEPDGRVGTHVVDLDNKTIYGLAGYNGDGSEVSDKVYYLPLCRFDMDEDIDGFDISVDDDDTDPTVYPDAPELCGDGKDNNQDGRVDEDCANNLKGDINTDGKVKVDDTIIGLKILSGIESSNINLQADVNNDGKIGIEEGIYALQINSEIIPVPCSIDDECSDIYYCKKDIGDCDGQGTCTPKPEVCEAVIDPVCGCNGVTYTNFCHAAIAGANIAYEGECNDDYSNSTLDGPWLFEVTNTALLFFIFDGNGMVSKGTMFNSNSSLDTYQVQPDGQYQINIYDEREEAYYVFNGVLSSPTYGTANIESFSGVIYKVSDPSNCEGSWTGTLSESGSSNSHPISFTVNSLGEITSFSGFSGPVTGDLFCESGKCVAFFKTAETNEYNQILLTGTLTGESISGVFEVDDGDDEDGTIVLTRQD